MVVYVGKLWQWWVCALYFTVNWENPWCLEHKFFGGCLLLHRLWQPVQVEMLPWMKQNVWGLGPWAGNSGWLIQIGIMQIGAIRTLDGDVQEDLGVTAGQWLVYNLNKLFSCIQLVPHPHGHIHVLRILLQEVVAVLRVRGVAIPFHPWRHGMPEVTRLVTFNGFFCFWRNGRTEERKNCHCHCVRARAKDSPNLLCLLQTLANVNGMPFSSVSLSDGSLSDESDDC